jgi:hypothetical protein
VAAGLADLRPLYIVLIMVGAWILVALAELTAERVDRSPLSYLLPAPEPREDEPDKVFGPRPEERTIVAPLDREPGPAEPEEPEPEPEPAATEPEVEPKQKPEPEPLTMPATVGVESALEPSLGEPSLGEPSLGGASRGGRLRSLLRRREPEAEDEPATPPRHVKLLPRREAPQPSRASREVAEFFGGEEPERPEESAS